MANAGLVDTLVVDNHKAWFWQGVWPALKVYPTVALRTGGDDRLGHPKGQPEAPGCVERFLLTNGRDSLNAPMIFRRYLLNTQYVNGASAQQGANTLHHSDWLFRKYGARYNIDWMLIAAQGYQESRLDQRAQPCRGDRRDAGHARYRQGAEGWQHQRDRSEHPRRREVRPDDDRSLLCQRADGRSQQDPLRICRRTTPGLAACGS